jgi:hypothetical protein
MKAPATRTGAVLRLWHQAARRARMAPIWRMASAVTAGRGVRPGWRSDVARHPARRAAPQLVHVQPSSRYWKTRVTPVDIVCDRDSEGRATPYHRATPATAPPPSRDPLPSRDPRHRAPAVARPPRSREPCNRPTRFSRPLVTANSAAAQFWAAIQLDRPSCASMLPHRVRSEPCKVLVALPCVPV